MSCLLPLFNESDWMKNVLSYCDLRDVMMLSLTSKVASSIPLSENMAQILIEGNESARRVDIQFLDLRNCTLGTIRLSLYRLIIGVMQPSFDFDRLGNVSIGAFCEDTDSSRSEEVFLIEKHLESTSYDQYDDFNPRHPDYKSHRRGGSFFNSDISDAASQAVAADLSLIAKMALNLDQEDENP